MTTNVVEQNIINFKNLSQNDCIFYIFEIDIKYNNNEYIKIRRIKNASYDNLITEDDFINNDINKIKFTIFNINDPLNTIIIKKKLTKNVNGILLFNNNKILIQLNNNLKYITCNYKFIN